MSIRALLFVALLAGCQAAEEVPADAGRDAAGTDTGAADTADTPVEDAAETDAGQDASAPVPCPGGVPCDDGDPCTAGDRCQEGECVGTPYACDDERSCTGNECDGDGGCLHEVQTGWCLVGNLCREHGETNPANTCERCDTDANRIDWSPKPDLSPCEDGNPCTFADACKKGGCVKGIKPTCDDQNECTTDYCDPVAGCAHSVASGTPCDDGDKCTAISLCSGGVCHAPAGQCDDGNPCTTDTCLASLGCEHVLKEGPCDDGDACTAGDTCVEGGCEPGSPAICDDGSDCTVDACDPLFGCYHELTGNPCCAGASHVCDDGDPCTADACDPDTFDCQNTPTDAPCDDDDPCTAGDQCAGGECVPGGEAACDDGNPCTTDLCDPAVGCQHAPHGGACDDGIPCTTGDTCQSSQCVGDASECKCEPDIGPTIAKATLLKVGMANQGLDVDANPATCAPASSCSGGIDNSLAPLAALMNESLVDEVEGGGLILLFELVGPKTDGTPFPIRLLAGKRANTSCDVQAEHCDYLIDPSALSEDCEPLIELDNARIVNGTLSAGGPGYNFPLQIPLFGDNYLTVNLFNGGFRGDITFDGDQVATVTNGVLGGAIPKSTFVAALELIPEGDLPVPKEQVVSLLDLIITNDIDTGPPAGPDAASIGLLLEAIGGTITGVD